MPAKTGADAVPSAGRSSFWLAAAVLVVGHVALTNHFVPAKAVFASQPIAGLAFDRHAGQVLRVVSALTTSGHTWLYDVQLHAGQPEGVLGDLDSKGWELWTFVLHRLGVPIPIAFNSFVWFWILTGPLWVFIAARCFGLTPGVSLVSAAMAASLWFFDSYLHWGWYSGMLGWCAASSLTLVALGMHARFVTAGGAAAAFGSAAVGATATLLHPAASLALLPAIVTSFVPRAQQRRRSQLLWPFLLVLACLAVNGYWLTTAWSQLSYLVTASPSISAAASVLPCDLLEFRCGETPTGEIGTRSGFRLLFLGLAIVGLYTWRRERDSRFVPLVVALSSLYALAYGGGLVPGLRLLQPYQVLVPAMLLSTLPAAAFTAKLRTFWNDLEGSRAVLVVGAVLLFSVGRQLIATQVLYFVPQLAPSPKIYPDGARSPLSKFGYVWLPDLPSTFRFDIPHDRFTTAGVQPITQWLLNRVGPGARLLVHDAALAEHIAARSSFEVLSGPREHLLLHAHAHPFAQPRKRSARDAERSALEFARYLHTYGIEWVVGDRAHLRDAPHALAPQTAVAGHHIYRVRQPGSRLLKGTGNIDARANRIRVSGTNPSEPLVLAYHFHPALRCDPSCRVERYVLDIDEIGFISVPAPHPANIVVRLSYED